MTSVRSIRASVLLLSVALLTCTDASMVDVLEIDASGFISGIVYLDKNGSETLDAADERLKSVPVVLTTGSVAQVVKEAQTDTAGVFRMLDVPVGTYRLQLRPDVLGDSLAAVNASNEPLTVGLGDTTRIDFGVGFPVLSVAQVRALPAGQRVFTSGIGLNSRVSFGDAQVHIQSDSTYLRLTNVARANIAVGDSLRVLGRTKKESGQTVLDDVTATVLISAAQVPAPVPLGTGAAATANGGKLDAALVRIRDAEIHDTATVESGFRFYVDDGSGRLEVFIRSFLQLNTSVIQPDSVVRASQITGLLVPVTDETGAVTWRLLPRGGADLLLEVKQVDVSVALKTSASVVALGDTLEISVIAANNGPATATGVSVLDTIPVGLALVSSSATRGAYDQATHKWALDTLRAKAADTLKLKVRVTSALSGNLSNRAWVTGVVGQADINPTNNVAQIGIAVVSSRTANIGVLMSVDRTTASLGDTVEFTLAVSNAGPLRATGVRIADTIPEGLTFLDAQPTRGSYAPGPAAWVIDTIQALTTESLRLRATVTKDTTATVVNRAVSVRAGQSWTDPVASNDTAQVSVDLVQPAYLDLSVTVTADKSTVSQGDTVTIKVVLANAGFPYYRDAVDATVVDTIPQGLKYLSAQPTRGVFNPGTGYWIIDTLKTTKADTLTLKAEVTLGQVGSIVNRAHAQQPVEPVRDTVTANNSAQVTFSVVAPSQARVQVQTGGRNAPAGPPPRGREWALPTADRPIPRARQRLSGRR